MRLETYSDLGQLLAALNAPGNDVFDSQDVAFESSRLAIGLKIAEALRFVEPEGAD